MTPQEKRRAARRALRKVQREALDPGAVALFHDIQVLPATSFRLRSVLTDGGPVWPDFATQTLVRISRRGRYVDGRNAALVDAVSRNPRRAGQAAPEDRGPRERTHHHGRVSGSSRRSGLEQALSESGGRRRRRHQRQSARGPDG